MQGQLMPMTGVTIEFITPKNKTKPDPLARLKAMIFWKSVVGL